MSHDQASPTLSDKVATHLFTQALRAINVLRTPITFLATPVETLSEYTSENVTERLGKIPKSREGEFTTYYEGMRYIQIDYLYTVDYKWHEHDNKHLIAFRDDQQGRGAVLCALFDQGLYLFQVLDTDQLVALLKEIDADPLLVFDSILETVTKANSVAGEMLELMKNAVVRPV